MRLRDLLTVSFDHLAIGGDFNAGLRTPTRAALFSDFLRDNGLFCVDQLPISSIMHTFLSDASGASSWIDHFVCDAGFASRARSVNSLQCGYNLSDHLPISVTFDFCWTPSVAPSSVPLSSLCCRTNWDLVTDQHVQNFCSLLASRLPLLPEDAVSCVDPSCTSHSGAISDFLCSLLECISAAAAETLPLVTSFRSRRLPGWNDGARALKSKANFWHRVWLEAGSPSAGVLTELRKKAKSRSKYEVRRLKRREQFIRRDKLAGTFTPRNRKSFWREVKKLRGKSHSASHSVIDGVSDLCEVSDIFRDKLADTLNKYAKHPFDPSSLVMVEDDLHCCSALLRLFLRHLSI